MPTLKETLLTSERRPTLVDACVQLVDDEVAAKGGLGGLAVKGAYAIVKKVKPGIIRDAVSSLLDEFVGKLEPFFAAHQNGGNGPFDAYLRARSAEVASALLGVTDAKAQKAKNRTIKKAYEKLRPTGQKHVEAAVPGIGRVISAHL